MQSTDSVSLLTSLLGGVAIGLIAGLLGALVRGLLIWKGWSNVPALAVGMTTGAVAGSALVAAGEQYTIVTIAVCSITGATVPLCSASKIFVDSDDEVNSMKEGADDSTTNNA